jgi:hypothetical protein
VSGSGSELTKFKGEQFFFLLFCKRCPYIWYSSNVCWWPIPEFVLVVFSFHKWRTPLNIGDLALFVNFAHENANDLSSRHKSRLQAHVATVHLKNQFPCEKCGKCFPLRGRLNSHIKKVHEGKEKIPMKCETCGRVLSCLGTYRNHLKIHTGEKPFKYVPPTLHWLFMIVVRCFTHTCTCRNKFEGLYLLVFSTTPF